MTSWSTISNLRRSKKSRKLLNLFSRRSKSLNFWCRSTLSQSNSSQTVLFRPNKLNKSNPNLPPKNQMPTELNNPGKHSLLSFTTKPTWNRFPSTIAITYLNSSTSTIIFTSLIKNPTLSSFQKTQKTNMIKDWSIIIPKCMLRMVKFIRHYRSSDIKIDLKKCMMLIRNRKNIICRFLNRNCIIKNGIPLLVLAQPQLQFHPRQTKPLLRQEKQEKRAVLNC